MRVYDAQAVARCLDHGRLVDAIRDIFRSGGEAPLRHQHLIDMPSGPATFLLLMPAWRAGEHIGVKVTTVVPGNAVRGLPSVHGSYLLFAADTGTPLAVMDGGELTLRRTAAASALASRYLSRPDSRCLLMMGTGRLAPHLVAAHRTQRPVERVLIWGRNAEKARQLAADLCAADVPAEPAASPEDAIPMADIISCATLARDPILPGRWLRAGQHVDLVGGFTPEMREGDDDVMRRGAVYVDTREGALAEAGDLVQPIRRQVLSPDAVRGDLFDLVRGRVPGRRSADEITVFKSVGSALEDLAAAGLVIRSGEGVSEGAHGD